MEEQEREGAEHEEVSHLGLTHAGDVVRGRALEVVQDRVQIALELSAVLCAVGAAAGDLGDLLQQLRIDRVVLLDVVPPVPP